MHRRSALLCPADESAEHFIGDSPIGRSPPLSGDWSPLAFSPSGRPYDADWTSMEQMQRLLLEVTSQNAELVNRLATMEQAVAHASAAAQHAQAATQQQQQQQQRPGRPSAALVDTRLMKQPNTFEG